MNDSPTPVYLVLGGSGGIGGATARRLAASGARVAIAARRAEPLEAVATASERITAHTVDATDLDAVESLVQEIAGTAGRLDGVVNCVGSIVLKAAHATSADDWRTTLDLNLTTAFAAVRSGAKAMSRSGGGSIVLLSTAAARTGLANHEAIAAAKAGVIGLARSAAATYAPKGVRVNVVAPGLVDTPMSAKILSNDLMRQASEAMHPLGRVGRPEEVASAIVWLLDPAQGWVTGQVLGVDGGLATVRPKAGR